MSLHRGFRRSASSFARLNCSVGYTVFAVIRMGLLVFQEWRLFDSSAFRIDLRTFAADGLNGHCLPLLHELIDGRLDQAHRALVLLLVVFQKPGMRLVLRLLSVTRFAVAGSRF